MGNSLHKPSMNPPHLELQNPNSTNPSDHFTCEICIEPMSQNQRFNNKNLCSHPFCHDCIAKFIQVQVLDNSIANINCPGLNCENHLDPLSCIPIIPPTLFSKWCDLLCDAEVLMFDKSFCPNRDCGQMVLNECGASNLKKSKCPNCKGFFCFQCKVQWDAGHRCEDLQQVRGRRTVKCRRSCKQRRGIGLFASFMFLLGVALAFLLLLKLGHLTISMTISTSD